MGESSLLQLHSVVQSDKTGVTTLPHAGFIKRQVQRTKFQ